MNEKFEKKEDYITLHKIGKFVKVNIVSRKRF